MFLIRLRSLRMRGASPLRHFFIIRLCLSRTVGRDIKVKIVDRAAICRCYDTEEKADSLTPLQQSVFLTTEWKFNYQRGFFLATKIMTCPNLTLV
jgi:hypothetical protein